METIGRIDGMGRRGRSIKIIKSLGSPVVYAAEDCTMESGLCALRVNDGRVGLYHVFGQLYTS